MVPIKISVAISFELQGAANSSPTRKICSEAEGAQFFFVLKKHPKCPQIPVLGAKIKKHNLNE